MASLILANKYIPKRPHPVTGLSGPQPKQMKFLLLDCLEAFYGGAAGGGKTDALLMAALMYVHVPGYSALILRRTYPSLSLPKAIMDRSHEWLDPTDAKWDGSEHAWTFPSGARLVFGYLDSEVDKYRYQSAEFQCIEFEEVTEFLESQYSYLFSRLRRLEGVKVPLRMRSASNPGGVGHDWVKQRFLVEGREKGRVFIPAWLQDNDYIDKETYIQSLMHLDPVTREQLLKGDWEVKESGGLFQRQWFQRVKDWPRGARQVRYWDLASTVPEASKDPDYTAGIKLAAKDGQYWVLDVKRIRNTPKEVEALIKQTTELDGKAVDVYMEQEPGSAGVNNIDHYARQVLAGYSFRGVKTTGDKQTRANPVSSAAEQGNIKVLEAPWNTDLLDELELFPKGAHDDQVDALSGAFEQSSTSAKPLFRFG